MYKVWGLGVGNEDEDTHIGTGRRTEEGKGNKFGKTELQEFETVLFLRILELETAIISHEDVCQQQEAF